MKRILSFFLIFVLLIFLIFFPKQALEEARTGLMLWFYTLLPSLLPFIILSNFLIKSGFLKPLLEKQKNFWRRVFGLSTNGSYALCMGIFCGYPMGAKTTADLYREGQISYDEACYLLTFSNYPGPSFLSAYLCAGLFKRPLLALPTCLVIYLSGLLCSVLFRIVLRPLAPSFHAEYEKKEISLSPSFGEVLDISIMNGFEAVTKLGGYIILFSMIQGILKKIPVFPIRCLLCGITEISTGTALLCRSRLPFSITYPLVLTLTSFGGLCVTAQTNSMLSGTDLPLSAYLKGKLCHSVCTCFFAVLLVKIIKIVV